MIAARILALPEFRGVKRIADCAGSLPERDARTVDPGNPWRFLRSTKWKKAMEGFFHGDLAGYFHL
jgi:hypothetical protein